MLGISGNCCSTFRTKERREFGVTDLTGPGLSMKNKHGEMPSTKLACVPFILVSTLSEGASPWSMERKHFPTPQNI